MAYYFLRRLLLGVLVLVGLSMITFLLARVAPGNPAALWVGPRATAAEIARARATLGLNRPLVDQYGIYMGDLLHGNLGVSVDTHQPVASDIASYLPASLELVVAAMLLAVVLGLPFGVLAAMRPGGYVDAAARLLAVLAVSVPTFWLAFLLQVVFFKDLGWLPVAGRLSDIIAAVSPVHRITGFTTVDAMLQGNWQAFGDAMAHLVLPTLTIAAYPFGLLVRMVRASLLDVLALDHIRLMRALGQKRSTIAFRYALKNALPPALTVLALTFAYSLTGTFLVESIFNWPGLGNYTAQAVITNDYPAIMGVTIIIGAVYVVLNLVVDMVIAWIDPRVRYA